MTHEENDKQLEIKRAQNVNGQFAEEDILIVNKHIRRCAVSLGHAIS